MSRRLLAEQLQRLEQQAAVVAALIDWSDQELVAEVMAGWAPMVTCTTCSQRRKWQMVWCDWLQDCAVRWARTGQSNATIDNTASQSRHT